MCGVQYLEIFDRQAYLSLAQCLQETQQSVPWVYANAVYIYGSRMVKGFFEWPESMGTNYA